MNVTVTRILIRSIIIVTAFAFSIGCGPTDTETPPDENTMPPLFVLQGWERFQSGDFNDAASLFIQALAVDPQDHRAHNGLGWSLLKLGNLQNAVASFDAAIDNGFTGADPHVGKVVIFRDRRPIDYLATIDEANVALAIDSEYAFAYDTDLDWRDVRLILAQAYFAIGSYVEANAQVSVLGGTPQDPSAPTFVADLLAELQALGQSIAS